MNISVKTKKLFIPSLSAVANFVLAISSHADLSSLAGPSPAIELNKPDNNTVKTINTNQLEVSFLKVYAGCKVDNSSFEPVQIDTEHVSDQVLMIHTQLEQA